MSELELNQAAPDFSLKDSQDNVFKLNEIGQKWIILYFYPKDNTSGCTLEAINFTEYLEEFQKNDAIVVGISPDSCKSHANFMKKHDLKILLLSDPEKEVIQEYGVWKLKKMYGKEYYGVERSTFLLDKDRKIVKQWKKVKVKGHVEEVLNTLKKIVAE